MILHWISVHGVKLLVSSHSSDECLHHNSFLATLNKLYISHSLFSNVHLRW